MGAILESGREYWQPSTYSHTSTGKWHLKKLLPLPWDKKQIRKNNVPELTRAEDKNIFDDLLSQLEKSE